MRTKHTFRLPPDLAGGCRLCRPQAVSQAVCGSKPLLASHLSVMAPTGWKLPAKRLDRMTGKSTAGAHIHDRNETMALSCGSGSPTPPLPDSAKTAAQAKGRERYEWL